MESKVVSTGRKLPSADECAELVRLWDSNMDKMNVLFQNYFGLNPLDRYMGSFPYADKETGQPRVAWHLNMGSCYMRDAIVACFRAAILESGLADIVVLKSDDDNESTFKTPWPAQMSIIAMGQSITNTIVGERRVQAALDLLEAWLSRA